MTALNFVMTKDLVCIAMDTLMMHGDSAGDPRMFTSKIYPLLHLNGVMCGTGLGNFIADWFVQINTGILARDMIHLNDFAQQSLIETASNYPLNNGEHTATIYHFGYSEEAQSFKGFAYVSADNFASIELPYGTGVKPAIDFSPPENIELPQMFIEIMEKQRLQEAGVTADQRIYIGGDIHYFYMTPGKIWIERCHRYSDYSALYDEMCLNLPANKEFKDASS